MRKQNDVFCWQISLNFEWAVQLFHWVEAVFSDIRVLEICSRCCFLLLETAEVKSLNEDVFFFLCWKTQRAFRHAVCAWASAKKNRIRMRAKWETNADRNGNPLSLCRDVFAKSDLLTAQLYSFVWFVSFHECSKEKFKFWNCVDCGFIWSCLPFRNFRHASQSELSVERQEFSTCFVVGLWFLHNLLKYCESACAFWWVWEWRSKCRNQSAKQALFGWEQ